MNDNLLVLSGDSDGISVSVGFDAAMNYALAHNGISPLQWIAIENESENELRDLSIEIKVSGDAPRPIAEPHAVGSLRERPTMDPSLCPSPGK